MDDTTPGDIEDIEIRGDMIRLGQLLKFANIAESGADAGAIVASGDVTVDGQVETRRGRQLAPGSLVEIHTPEGVIRIRPVGS